MLRQLTAVLCSLLLIAGASVAPVAAGSTAQTAQNSAYAGTHVSFETTNNAIVGYTVQDETVLQQVSVQSQSAAESDGVISVGASLSAMTDLVGAALSLQSQNELNATVAAESGATVEAHDTERGVLVVAAGDDSQYVQANLSSGAEVQQESDSRVLVTTESGTTGAFVVAGGADGSADGSAESSVTVNEDGNVSAALASDQRLVFRTYADGRSEAEAAQERLIAEGTAAAEVYVTQKSESSSEVAAGVVSYGQDTTVEVTERSEGTVTMTAERSQHEGKVVITSVSESAMEASDDLSVTVDGEAAAQASSYSELEGAIGSDQAKYMVRQSGSAQANADVLVAVNHFSTREITMTEDGQSGDGDSSGDGDDGGSNDGDGNDADGSGSDGGSGGSTPGFTAGLALVALAAAGVIGAREL